MSDLPNLNPALLAPPDLGQLEPPARATHKPRILLLYGSLRERSFSRLLSQEAARLLEYLGAEARIFRPARSALTRQCVGRSSQSGGATRAIGMVGGPSLDQSRATRRDDRNHESANRLDSAFNWRCEANARQDARGYAGIWRVAVL